MRRICRTALLVVPVLAAAPALAEDVDVATAEEILTLGDRGNPPPVSPASVSSELAAESPEGFPAMPEGVTGLAFGTVEFAGSKVAVTVGASDGSKADRLLIDGNGDGAFAAEEVLSPVFGERGPMVSAGVPRHDFVIGGRTLPSRLSVFRRGADAAWNAGVVQLWYRTGEFRVGDQDLVLSLVDMDLDGDYGGEKDRWHVRTKGIIERPASAYVLEPFGAGTFLAGHRFCVAAPKDGVARVTAAAADGPLPADLAADRTRVEHIWSERFDEEREEFVAARELDVTRKRATAAIDWRWVTFDEAKALSAAEGKPLFVDVLAYWCVWCYRMDYYTYVDAEVTARLNESFVPVKIIQEQDPAGDYDRIMKELEARGIPAMGIWAPDGKLVHKIGGWTKPEDFLAELQKGLDGVKEAGADPAPKEE